MESVVVGVASSFVASAFFFGVLFLMRPKIVIAPKIAFDPNARPSVGPPNRESPEQVFKLKFFNNARRPAIDVKVQLILVNPYNDEMGNQQHRHTRLSLVSEDVVVLPKRSRTKSDPACRFARKVRIKENLHDLWREDGHCHLLVRLYAKDGWTGTGKVFEERIYSKAAIVVGDFEAGTGVDVTPVSSWPSEFRPPLEAAGRPVHFGSPPEAPMDVDDRSISE